MFLLCNDDYHVIFADRGDVRLYLTVWRLTVYQQWVELGYNRRVWPTNVPKLDRWIRRVTAEQERRSQNHRIWNARFWKLSNWTRRVIAEQERLEEQERINRRTAFAMAFHPRLLQSSYLSDIADLCTLIVPDI